LLQLEFNIQKCRVIHFGANNPLCQNFMESGDGSKQPLICSHGEKGMGVLVDDKLNLIFHTQSVVASTNQTLGLIKRTFRITSPAMITKLLKAMMRPKLEFGICIATPVNRGDISILESVQQCATKCITGFQHLPYSTQLHKLKLPSLTYRHRQGDVLMIYKLVCDQSVIPNLFQIVSSPSTRGHPLKLYKNKLTPGCKTNSFLAL
jgi:hypothetical protein